MPTVIDTRGLKCPLPILRVRKAMRVVPAGECVTVLATDPDAVGDIEVYCRTTGCVLRSSSRSSIDEWEFVLEQAARFPAVPSEP